MAINVAIITISDKGASGCREDVSGPTIERVLGGDTYNVCERKIVPDDCQAITDALRDFSDQKAMDLVLTTGGTGLGPRDVTPEATTSVCDRMVPGLSEILRSESFTSTPNAVLSRGVSGVRKNTLIVNLPGSPKAVRECLEIVLKILPHAVEMMRGGGH
jgi:molybdenum cofactor synthesis domain-containing protein